MTINYQFGDVDAHGAMIRALAGLLEAEHQAIISDVLTASDFWGGAGSAACQGFRLSIPAKALMERAGALVHSTLSRGRRAAARAQPLVQAPGFMAPPRDRQGPADALLPTPFPSLYPVGSRSRPRP